MRSLNVDYVTTYFELPTLRKIHGEPTYENLYKLKNQSKENDSAITSDLGGGVNDHLGLVYTLVKYVNVNTTVYTHSLHPGPLHIDVLVTKYAATRLREEYRDAVRVFREIIDV